MDRLTRKTDGVAEATTDNIHEIISKLSEYEDTGFTPKQIRSLALAKRSGRLLVLPGKIGSTFYRVFPFGEFPYLKSAPYRILKICLHDRNAYNVSKCFGDTVFATKEDAEARRKELCAIYAAQNESCKEHIEKGAF